MNDRERRADINQPEGGTKPGASALQRALVALEKAEKKIVSLERSKTESIAIVGMACRFPGGASGLDAYWRLLQDGMDGIREVPQDRWTHDPSFPSGARWGGFVDGINEFDARFFGISPREAAMMDPHHRLLLEVTWDALENAGLLDQPLIGSNTGVFVGSGGSEYTTIALSGDLHAREGIHSVTGLLGGALAGRISYLLGLQGPCVVVDTACSSSASALHLACRSLRTGECDMAITGAISLMLTPAPVQLLSQMGALSPSGQCKTFDAAADGYVRGEGCGMVVLKRLSDAERDGDRIWALIRGTAMNQDGRSSGLAAPNMLAQQAVVRRALEEARVSASQVGYVETHGTGTSLGDPIEVEALKEVYGRPREDGSKCLLGAVKANIGHLEATAAVAGLIKTALVLHHDIIPGQINFNTLNPRISLDGTSLAISTKTRPWARNEGKRIAGLSSFGASGTNVHAILEEAPATVAKAKEPRASSYLLPISAKSPQALVALAASYSDYLRHPDQGNVDLYDIVYTASLRRSHHAHRLVITGKSREEMADALSAFVRGELSPNVGQGKASAGARQKVVFVFQGQGAQWLGMGRQLYREEPVFRDALIACDEAIRKEAGFSVVEELDKPAETSQLNETIVVQPVLFAVAVALSALLQSWGIAPSAVIGHSFGEIAAAHVAGQLDLTQAARLVTVRARVMQKATGHGKMVSVSLNEQAAKDIIAGLEDRVGIAAINDPSSVVLSGENDAIDAIVERLSTDGVKTRLLRVKYASHSPQVQSLLAEFSQELGDFIGKVGSIPMISTVTGKPISQERLDTAYWATNIRQTVRFAEAVAAIASDERHVFVEVGPHPALAISMEQTLAARNVDNKIVPTLRRDKDERQSALDALGALFAHGCAIDWKAFFPNGGRVVQLPAYSWQRQHFESAAQVSTEKSRSAPIARKDPTEHPLLGKSLSISTLPGVRVWEALVGPRRQPFLVDHCVGGEIVFPGAGCLEMAVAAATEVHGPHSFTVHGVSFDQMCVFSEDEERIMQFVLEEKDGKTASFRVSTRAVDDHVWTLHYAGSFNYTPPVDPLAANETPAEIMARCPEVITAAEYYEKLRRRDMHFGPSFQGIQQIWKGNSEALGRVRLTEIAAKDAHAYRIHPALIDACGQIAFSFVLDGDGSNQDTTYVGMEAGQFRIYEQLPSEVWAHFKAAGAVDAREGMHRFHATIMSDDGRVLAEARDVFSRRLEEGKAAAHTVTNSVVFAGQWQKNRHWSSSASASASASIMPAISPGTSWLVFLDERGLGQAIVSQLKSLGHECIGVTYGKTFARIDTDAYQVDFRAPGDFDRLLVDAFGSKGRCRGVLYLWGLDGANWEQTNITTIADDQMRGTIGALHATQALLRRDWPEIPPLWLVTRGVQQVDDESAKPVAVSQAPLWGMGKTLQWECPELRCVCVDLRAAADVDEAAWVLRELGANDGENRVALRENGRHVHRLVRSSFAASAREPVALRSDATYLITGGLGGLGLFVAQWMVENGARCLVLAGRRPPSDDAKTSIEAMSRTGAKIHVFQGDVSERQDVEAMLATIDASMPPLRGIIHAAGVLEDHSILELTADHFQRVFAPKVQGTWYLHALTLDRPLDFFVLYSSGSAVFGTPAQANYAAANTFLDAMARARHAAGLPAMSIQWGPFSEVGLAVAKRGSVRATDLGFDMMTPKQGNAALARLFERPRAEVSIQRLNVRRILETIPQLKDQPFMAELRNAARLPEVDSRDSLQFKETLARAAAEHKPVLLEEHIKQQLGRILRMNAQDIDGTASFPELGMDSLMSLELRNRLELSLGSRVLTTTLFTHSTASALTAHLLVKLGLS